MVDVTMLGPFRAVVNDEEGDPVDVTPSAARERTALAALALAAPGSLTIEAIATELYGDDGVADPKNAVQAVVSRLRKALGSDAIETTSGGYRAVGMDLDVDDMRAARAAHDIGAALAHWTGPTLTDVDCGPLLRAEQARLDEVRAELTERQLAERADRDPVGTIADLEAAVAAAPLRERRWDLLMRALYRSGRQAEALRAFQRARTHLGAELGLEPGPALTELEQQILLQDTALDVQAPPAPLSGSRAAVLPTGIVTVLLCDAEGSVRRWEAKPADTASEIAEMHRRWEDVVTDHDGVVVKSTGDGVLAVFARATDAIRAAAAGQTAQRSSSLRVRAALHTGEVVDVDGDVRGPTVNRCARLMELAHGDQILMSGVTVALGADAFADDLTPRALGAHWLRDVPDPVDVHQLAGPSLPASFPELRSAGPSQLPRLRTAVLGRDDLVEEVSTLVGEEPLVTVVGTGGMGKTTLSLAVGWHVTDLRTVTFVDLASVRDPAVVPVRIAETLTGNDPNDQRPPIQRIVDRLAAHPDLLVIDNAEHVLDMVASTVDEVLRHELKGSLLVTSRQALAVAGERVVRLPPLPLPTIDADLEATSRNPSVQLFVERMRAAKPDAELPQGLLPVVAHICRRLDGIPLAIELAAGRAGLLAVEDIAARLDDQLRLLRQVPATREARHASLEAVAQWSLDQLAGATRDLFRVLAVMAGPFDVAGAEQVATNAGLDPLDTLDGLSEMVAASLLANEAGGRRFRMLEPIRQLALTELDANGTETVARRAHAEWITSRAVDACALQDERRPQQYRGFDADADQLISALRFSTQQIGVDDPQDPLDHAERAERAGSLSLAASFWFLEQDPGTGTNLVTELEQRIDRTKHPLAWARALIAKAATTATMPVDGMGDDAVEALAIFDQFGDPDAGLARLGAIFTQFASQDGRAFELVAEAERLIPTEARWNRAILDLVTMMIVAIGSDEIPAAPTDAIEKGERAASEFRRLGDRWALGATLGELGRLQRLMGDYEGASARYTESIELFGDLHYHGMHYILTELAQMASLQGDHEEARRLHARSVELASIDGSASCRAQAVLGSARSELMAGNETEAAARLAEVRELHPDWELLSFGLEEIDARLQELLPE